jgi:hypothetical protein
MRVTRRNLLAAAVAVPAMMVAEPITRSVVSAISEAARASRPLASGTTATRCAQCGSDAHTMLDAGCSLAPKVLG